MLYVPEIAAMATPARLPACATVSGTFASMESGIKGKPRHAKLNCAQANPASWTADRTSYAPVCVKVLANMPNSITHSLRHGPVARAAPCELTPPSPPSRESTQCRRQCQHRASVHHGESYRRSLQVGDGRNGRQLRGGADT